MADYDTSIYFKGIKVNGRTLQNRLKRLVDDDVMLKIYRRIWEGRSKRGGLQTYVPFKTGNLIASAQVTKEGITWNTDYAHYVYVGKVYGPNIPIRDKSGEITGFRSRPGISKHYTGRRMRYTRGSGHSNAGRNWDTRFVNANVPWITKNVEQILKRNARRLNKQYHWRIK